MNTFVIIVAVIGVLAGFWAAIVADARIAGIAAALVGLAVLIPLILK